MMPAQTTRCLWLARALPFPLDSGDRIYSAQLARALGAAGARVHFLGHAPNDPTAVPKDWPVHWQAVAGGRHPTWRALASLQPLNGAIHATPAYRKQLVALLGLEWEMVVLDHYGMGWALETVQSAMRHRARPAVTVHISHNHEASLWQGMFRGFRGSPLRKLGMWQNMHKVDRVEQRLAGGVDLLSCITAEDVAAFEQRGGPSNAIVLTPGFNGLRMPDRRITPATPRRVVMFGSFRWVAKQENLRALAQAADTAFREHNIELDVIGDVPDELRRQLAPYSSVTVHGFVDDVAPYFQRARLALVPELMGGGFKLKFLDYVFGRMPVVTLDDAAAGLPPTVRRAMLGCTDMDDLVNTVVTRIDDLPELDRLQREAFAAAESAFDWSDRGSALLSRVRELSGAAPRRRPGLQPMPRLSA